MAKKFSELRNKMSPERRARVEARVQAALKEMPLHELRRARDLTQTTLAKAMGGIRVDRGTGSDEPLQSAIEALAGGEMVGLMPQGTIPRGPAFFDPELKGRWGAARLHQLTGAPVIPIGLWGTEKVWPRSSRLPNVANVTDPPTVRIRVGPPVRGLKRRSMKADTARIMKAIVEQLPPEARRRRNPTAEELAATYPPGYKGDPDAEADRRPGTD